jgi:hypothetical protein
MTFLIITKTATLRVTFHMQNTTKNLQQVLRTKYGCHIFYQPESILNKKPKLLK